MRQLPHPTRSQITLTEVLAALSDPVRLAVVSRLFKSPGEHNWTLRINDRDYRVQVFGNEPKAAEAKSETPEAA